MYNYKITCYLLAILIFFCFNKFVLNFKLKFIHCEIIFTHLSLTAFSFSNKVLEIQGASFSSKNTLEMIVLYDSNNFKSFKHSICKHLR